MGDTSSEVERRNAVCSAGSSYGGPYGDPLPDRQASDRRGRMSQTERFKNLLQEFQRVGVDPNTISAGLAVREQDVLRALAALPDDAGPAAFLSQLRLV